MAPTPDAPSSTALKSPTTGSASPCASADSTSRTAVGRKVRVLSVWSGHARLGCQHLLGTRARAHDVPWAHLVKDHVDRLADLLDRAELLEVRRRAVDYLPVQPRAGGTVSRTADEHLHQHGAGTIIVVTVVTSMRLPTARPAIYATALGQGQVGSKFALRAGSVCSLRGGGGLRLRPGMAAATPAAACCARPQREESTIGLLLGP